MEIVLTDYVLSSKRLIETVGIEEDQRLRALGAQSWKRLLVNRL